MTTLRKKIFHFKIQKIISENKFVLFFQFNNVKFTDWIFLKNQIFNFKNINVIVIKNKIPYKTFLNNQAKIEFFSPFNDSKLSFKTNFTEEYVEYKNYLQGPASANTSTEMYKNLSLNPQKLNFLCQGPTLIIYFNSINQCKAVYDILNQYTSNFSCTESIPKSEFFDSHKYKKSCLNTINLPLLFLQKKSNLHLQKHNSIKKKNMKSTFFFIGGFFKGKTINHLDFEKLLQLNSSIYVDLIMRYSNPVLRMFLFNVIVKIKFLKCFQNNLLSLLNVYKHNLKKISV
jgi:ribosomal protein L10